MHARAIFCFQEAWWTRKHEGQLSVIKQMSWNFCALHDLSTLGDSVAAWASMHFVGRKMKFKHVWACRFARDLSKGTGMTFDKVFPAFICHLRLKLAGNSGSNTPCGDWENKRSEKFQVQVDAKCSIEKTSRFWSSFDWSLDFLSKLRVVQHMSCVVMQCALAWCWNWPFLRKKITSIRRNKFYKLMKTTTRINRSKSCHGDRVGSVALEETGRNPGRACEPGRLLACWFRFRCDEHVLQ